MDLKIQNVFLVICICAVSFAAGYFISNKTKDKDIIEGNIENYGAIAVEEQPGFDSREAIQKAIDNGVKTLYVPDGKTFEIGIDGKNYDGKGSGIGLNLKSNMKIYGGGTLKAKDNIGGSFTLLGNTNDSIENVTIEEITIDGNYSNANNDTSRSNIVLFGAINSRISNVKSINSPYVGIMIRGGSSNTIENNYVNNSNYIGIQIHKQSGTRIEGNEVYNSKDNAIDVEGNVVASEEGEGSKIIISKNVTDKSKSGIFIESTGKTNITSNHVYNTTHGAVYINRINSGSFYNIISDNQFVNEEQSEIRSGIIVANSSGKTIIHDNIIKGYTYGIKTNLNSNNLLINDNYFGKIAKYLIFPEKKENSLVKSEIGLNFLEEKQVSGFPKTIPETEDSRTFNVSVVPAKSLETDKSIRDNYYYKESKIEINNAQSVSVFNAGATKLTFKNDPPNIGDIIKLKGIFYKVTAKDGNVVTIISVNANSGDYPNNVDENNAVYIYTEKEYQSMIND